jgi:hypothetical protein
MRAFKNAGDEDVDAGSWRIAHDDIRLRLSAGAAGRVPVAGQSQAPRNVCIHELNRLL